MFKHEIWDFSYYFVNLKVLNLCSADFNFLSACFNFLISF